MSHSTAPLVLQPCPTSHHSASAGVVAAVVSTWGYAGLSLPSVLCLKLFTALPTPWPVVDSLEVQGLGSSGSCRGSEQRFKRRSPGVEIGGHGSLQSVWGHGHLFLFGIGLPPRTLTQRFLLAVLSRKQGQRYSGGQLLGSFCLCRFPVMLLSSETTTENLSRSLASGGFF